MRRRVLLMAALIAVLAAWLVLRRFDNPRAYRIAYDLAASVDEAAVEMPRVGVEDLFEFEGDGWLFRPNGNLHFSGSSTFWNRMTLLPGRPGAGRGEVSFRYRTQGPGGFDHRLSFVFHESARARLELRLESSGRAALVHAAAAGERLVAEAAVPPTNGGWRDYRVRVEGSAVTFLVEGKTALRGAVPGDLLDTVDFEGAWALEFSRRGDSYHPGDALFRRLELSRESATGGAPLEALAFRRDPSLDETTIDYLNRKYEVTRSYVPLRNRPVRKQIELGLMKGRTELLPALLAPAGARFRFPLELEPGDRLRLRYGVVTPVDATFRVELTVGEESRVLHESAMSAIPQLDEIDLPLPLRAPAQAEVVLAVDSARGLEAIGLLGAPVVVRSSPRGEPRRPNVIVISADTLRRDRVGAYGERADLTPSIDSFAASATLLTRAYAVSPWTMPSHFSLLSARYPSHHGLNRAFGLNPPAMEEVETLAEILAREGYVTAAIASDHSLDPANGFDKGFHSFLDNEVRDVAPLLEPLERFLEKHARDEFFLFLHSYDPHAPLFRGGTMTESDRDRLGEEVQYNDFVELGGATSRDRELVEELYDAHVREYDANFHRIVELFERYGVLDDSIVVFTSDHGEELFEHGAYQHGHQLWEEVLRVPLIVRFPDGARFPKRSDQLTGLIDVLPTILDYLELDVPAGIDGASFLSVLEGREEAHRRYLLAEALAWGPERKAVITDRYKYVVTFAEGDLPWLLPRVDSYDAVMNTEAKAELFDLRSDPREQVSVLEREAELASRMKLLLAPLLEPSARRGGGVDVDPARIDALRSLGYIR